MAHPQVDPSEAVFLSASVPDPRRDPKYIHTADLTAIREAVRALAVVATATRMLVFGSHPAITPFVLLAARSLGREHRVIPHVSEFFRAKVQPELLAFPHLVWTPEVPGDRDASLALMRDQMFAAYPYSAGIFLGGMEGVEQEFHGFQAHHPNTPVYPVASTGAAAKRLFDAGEGPKDPTIRDALAKEYTYMAMLQRLPGIAP